MNACTFAPADSGYRCTACGRFVRSTAPKPPVAVCRGPRGLGDLVADGLSAVGLTKERAQAVASAVGIKDCGCGKRQAALNAVGKRLGIGVDSPATITGEREADATQAATAEGQAS
jgi:hypothetical protein